VGLVFGWGLNSFAMLATTTLLSAYALDCFPGHAALAGVFLNIWRATGELFIFSFLSSFVLFALVENRSNRLLT
jgi:hypothetical protein